MTVHSLSIVGIVHPEGFVMHAVAGIDEVVRDDNGDIVICGILHAMDGELEPEDCPVASRWTLLVSR